MSSLEKIGIRVAPFSGKPVIARFGKDPQTALETRECLDEFLHAIKEFVGVGHAREFGNDDEWYEVLVRALPRPKEPRNE